MLRFLRYLIEFVAAFVGFIILLLLLLVWRLNAGPISSDFLTPYIEAATEGLLPGSDVHATGTLLSWNEDDHSVSFHADEIKINDEKGGEIADIPKLDARISLLGFLFGQFMPRDLAIDQPHIHLERDKSGAFVFGGMQVSKGDQTPQSDHHRSIKDTLRAISGRLSHALLMNKLSVTQAAFSVHDDVTGKDWTVHAPEISIMRNNMGALDHDLESGALNGRMVFEVTQKDAPASLTIDYIYDPQRVQHRLSTTFDNLTPAFLAGGHPETLGLSAAAIIDLPLSGSIGVVLDKNLTVEAANAHIQGGEGHLDYADYWDAPCPVKSLDAAVDYDRDTQKLTISDSKIDFGGPVLSLTADGAAAAQPGQDMDFTLDLQVDTMPMNDYATLWPKPILPDPRYWLAANLRDGMFKHAEATLKGSLAWNDLGNLSINDGNGKLSAIGGRVTYLDGMPPAENVSADAAFDLKRMSVNVTGGGIGNIRLMPFTLEITGLADPDQYISIPLQVGGPIPEVLKLLDHQPLGYAKKLGIAPDDIDGRIAGEVDFKFPLLKTIEMKDLDIKARANATDVTSSKLVPGIAIDQGNLALALDMKGVTFKGQADIDKVPFQINWQENFEQQPGQPLRQAVITGIVRDDQWAGMGIKVFNGSKGPVNVTLNLTRPSKNRSQLSGTIDMTAAAMQVDLLGWKKPANAAAIFKFNTDTINGQPVKVTSIDLRGDQIAASGKAMLSPDMGQLLSLDLQSLKLGRSDAVIHMTQSFGANGAMKLDASGKALDISGLRNMTDESDAADHRAKQYHVQLDRLYTSPFGEIDMAQGSAIRDGEGWTKIDLHGVVGEQQKPMSIALLPQPDGHRTLDIHCDDFGGMMKSLGFTDTVRGGTLSVAGASTVENPRLIDGTSKISSFTIVKLPALALLLNAMSPFGFSNILTDSADFSRSEGEFRWDGDTLTVTKAHAAGSAIGINIEGKVDLNSGVANLQGTLVPFSVMNNMLNYIPIIGGIITGGDNQGVLAVAYEIKGPLGSPSVSVNPVSLLTPGFLRNLFFGDNNEEDER